MAYCNGWKRVGHRTDEPLVVVYILGCPHCGGACGDTGEMLSLCAECLEDLKNDETASPWAQVEERG